MTTAPLLSQRPSYIGLRVSESWSVLEPLLGFLQRARGGSPPFLGWYF